MSRRSTIRQTGGSKATEEELVALFRDAIRHGRPLEFWAKGHRRLACPHVLGRKAGQWRVLVWQYDGRSESGNPSNWRCFALCDIAPGATALDDPWVPGWTKGYETHCVETVDMQSEGRLAPKIRR